MGVSLNLNKLVDKGLEGLTPKHDELLAEFKIKTIRDLGNWKYAAKAQALIALTSGEEA